MPHARGESQKTFICGQPSPSGFTSGSLGSIKKAPDDPWELARAAWEAQPSGRGAGWEARWEASVHPFRA